MDHFPSSVDQGALLTSRSREGSGEVNLRKTAFTCGTWRIPLVEPACRLVQPGWGVLETGRGRGWAPCRRVSQELGHHGLAWGTRGGEGEWREGSGKREAWQPAVHTSRGRRAWRWHTRGWRPGSERCEGPWFEAPPRPPRATKSKKATHPSLAAFWILPPFPWPDLGRPKPPPRSPACSEVGSEGAGARQGLGA